ncbi:hypothetical protein [Pseudoponticoccus marisrubri]|uniref:Uncharacterized protein n=1 Tax=Pseudoponticoccus marisrubri TaxID=1685382 RepID=A0A0W7WEN6_9RHOB|nr:hypothetical protein [Pseudoponticoccus marisrubri]KUF09029.1 hypothetical protein AVJ23_19730 [Pseudoponticoccus marisrubri]
MTKVYHRLLGWLLAICLLACLVLLAAFSLKFLLSGNASQFQRLGSLVVAFSAISFGSLLWVLPKLRQLVTDLARYSHIELVEEAIARSDTDALETLEATRRDGLVEANTVSAFERIAFRCNLALVVIGTLQWGYGDLFTCWVNGQGWRTC